MFRVIRVEKKFCHWLIDKKKILYLTNQIAIHDLILERALHSELPIIRPDRK